MKNSYDKRRKKKKYKKRNTSLRPYRSVAHVADHSHGCFELVVSQVTANGLQQGRKLRHQNFAVTIGVEPRKRLPHSDFVTNAAFQRFQLLRSTVTVPECKYQETTHQPAHDQKKSKPQSNCHHATRIRTRVFASTTANSCVLMDQLAATQ